MSLLTSNDLADIAIISAIFVLLVMIYPVSADNQADYLVSASSVGDIYAGDVIVDPIGSASCPAGCTGIANYPAWNVFAYSDPAYYSTQYWRSISGYITTDFTVPGRGSYTKLAACVVCTGCPGQSNGLWYPVNGGYYTWTDGTRPAPSISISVDPSSGTPSFVSTATITGKTEFDTLDYFNVTAPNSTVINLGGTSAPITIDQEGYWTVRAQVHNNGGSGSASANILGGTVYPPVAAFSCSPTNTTSPSLISCTDSSTHIPTGWVWQLTSFGVSMSPGGSYGSGTYSAVNTTQNPSFSVSGSGMIDVRLTASNAFGSSQEYKPDYITVEGVAPTPTPTPAIPWPNQTGICLGSAITLGSGTTYGHSERVTLSTPNYGQYGWQYDGTMPLYIDSNPLYTNQLGQWIYQEFNANTGALEYRMSYVVENCITPTPTPTVSYYPTPVYPTGTWTYTTSFPTSTYTLVPYTVPVTQPTMYPTITMPPTIATIATLPPSMFGNDDLYNYTITSSPYSRPFIDFIRWFQDTFMAFIPGGPINLVVVPMRAVISNYGEAVTQVISLLILFSAYPLLFFYAAAVIIKYMPLKVQLLISLVLWMDVVFYVIHHYRKKGET